MDTIKPFYNNGEIPSFDRFVVCTIEDSYRCVLMGIRPDENVEIGTIMSGRVSVTNSPNVWRSIITVVFVSPSMLDAVHILNAYEVFEM